MMEGLQHGRCISLVRWKIFSTDVSHHQYGGFTSSVQWKICNVDLSHYQYGGGCTVQDYQTCSECSSWLYLSKKYDTLQTVLFNPDFILMGLNPDVC